MFCKVRDRPVKISMTETTFLACFSGIFLDAAMPTARPAMTPGKMVTANFRLYSVRTPLYMYRQKRAMFSMKNTKQKLARNWLELAVVRLR